MISHMALQKAHLKPKYDSDDQSSMVSEPGSPQDIAMSSGDEDMADSAPSFSQSPEDTLPSTSIGKLPTNIWQSRMRQTNRVPTPIQPPGRPGTHPLQTRTGTRQHIRQRHPQENISTATSGELLEVPSPIDEDEVPTPPSAAEAAGSQLSMLTVNDMDMEPSSALDLPTISVDPSLTPRSGDISDVESAIDIDPMDDSESRDSRLTVRKQRQRSGALSSGQGSPSPVRADPNARRGFSMGFRADCEKCRMRVPGHMNHFLS